MLLIYSVYARFIFHKNTTPSLTHGGGVSRFSSFNNYSQLTNNISFLLFIVFVEMPLSAFRVPYSLSAPGTLFSLGDIWRPADGRCGLLIHLDLRRKKDEYNEKENVRRTG